MTKHLSKETWDKIREEVLSGSWFFKEKDDKGDSEGKMLEECNFKSKIRHRDSPGCNLTPEAIVCPGEEDCILYHIYYNAEKNK